MKKTTLAIALLSIGLAGSAQAASFLNGGFEDGTFSGWTQGSGYNTGSTAVSNSPNPGYSLALNPTNYLPGGANYNAGYQASAVVGAGTDAITGLSTVKYGNYSARINDSTNNYSVNVIKQSVSNYDGTSINFAWAAVLEASHTATDSDIFGLRVVDTTTGAVLYNASYSSATAPGVFQQKGSWFYNDWTEVSLSVTQGHNFEVSLLAADCPYGGHAGYVYLDGFGTTQGGGGDNGSGGNVPEPGSLALAGLGLLAALGARRRKSA